MELLQFFIQLQQQFRILHWETKSYARHKAYGEIYDSLDDLIDTFVETHMGKYGRPKFDTMSVELNSMKNVKVNDLIGNAIDYLNNLGTQLDQNDTDLLNIRDEMLGELNKLKYLLTLK